MTGDNRRRKNDKKDDGERDLFVLSDFTIIPDIKKRPVDVVGSAEVARKMFPALYEQLRGDLTEEQCNQMDDARLNSRVNRFRNSVKPREDEEELNISTAIEILGADPAVQAQFENFLIQKFGDAFCMLSDEELCRWYVYFSCNVAHERAVALSEVEKANEGEPKKKRTQRKKRNASKK